MGAPIEEMKMRVVAQSSGNIDGDRGSCRAMECQMGNLVADAMLDRVADQGIEIAIQNGGGLRASIDAGDVTMGEVLTFFRSKTRFPPSLSAAQQSWPHWKMAYPKWKRAQAVSKLQACPHVTPC